MKKVDYKHITNELIIDIRDHSLFREGHLKNSLNITAKQLPKYWASLVEENRPLVAVIEKESDLDDFPDVDFIAYILFAEILITDLVASESIQADDFLQLATDYTLVDLRHPDEITRPAPKKHLVNIPLENLSQELDQLNQNDKIYLLCGSGGRATAGESYLSSHGFTNAVVIEGGIKAIIEAQN